MAPSSLIWKLAVASISLSMSGSLSVYAQPQPTTSSTASAPTLACPGANEQTYTDSHGIQYIIGCGSDTTSGNYDVVDIPSNGSFVDCFNYCSTNYASTSNCTAFTFSGNTESGAGSGQCFLKSFTTEQFSQGTNDQVAAIRRQNYAVGLYTPGDSTMPATSTSTSTTSTSSQSTATPVACPQGNGQLYTDPYGRQYAIGCNALAGGYIYANVEISSNASIMDCFDYCSNNYELPSGSCTAFTFVEATQMDGETAYCQLENSTNPTFIYGYNDEIAAIWNPATTTTTTSMPTSSSSTVTSSSSSPTVSPTTLSCSGSEEYSWTAPSGVQYVISCGGAVSGSSYYTLQLPSDEGWQDCLDYCAQNYSQPVGGCTGMTYQNNNGASYNVTGGSCYLNNDTSEFLLPYDNVYSVGAARKQNYVPFTTTSTTTSSSQSTSSTAAPSPTCTSGYYEDANFEAYTINCTANTNGNTASTQTFDSGNYTQCTLSCDGLSGCSGWTWLDRIGGGGTCEFKTGQLNFTAVTAGSDRYVSGKLEGRAPAFGPPPSSSPSSATTSSTSSATTTTSMPTSSTSTSSTSTSPSSIGMGSSSRTLPSCPGSNGQTYTDESNIEYIIGCGNVTTGTSYYLEQIFPGESWQACLQYCSQNVDQYGRSENCTAFTYYDDGPGYCYFMEESSESFLPGDSTNIAAIRMLDYAPTPSTSTSSLSTASPTASCSSGPYTEVNNRTYMIQCNADMTGSGNPEPSFSLTGGNYTQCITYCDQNVNCTGWTWVPQGNGNTEYTCQLKNGQIFQAGGQYPGWVGAFLVTYYVSSTASSISSATTSTQYSASSSTTTSSSSPSPTFYPTGLSCPGSNGQTWTDPYGVQWIIGCSNTTTGMSYHTVNMNSSYIWQDCLDLCTQNYLQPPGGCTSMFFINETSWGGVNTCYLNNEPSESFQPGYIGDFAAIRMQNYTPPTSTSVSSSSYSTTASPSPTCSCGQYTDTNNMAYTIQCNSGVSGHLTSAGGSFTIGNYTNCPPYCDRTDGCSGWIWHPNPGTDGDGGDCDLYSGQLSFTTTVYNGDTAGILGNVPINSTICSPATTTSQSAVTSATVSTSPSATCSPGPYTDTNGISYTIQCDSDTSMGASSSQIFNSGYYTQCMPICDGTSGCSAWSWVPYADGGGICYFKTGQNTFSAGSAGEVAGILAGSSPTTATSSVSSSTMSGQAIGGSATTATSPSGSQTGSQSTASSSTMSYQTGSQPSISSATSSSSSASPTVSAVASCPGSNGQTVTDSAGVSYQIACDSDTSGGNYDVYDVQNGFNDCFAYCDNSIALNTMICTAWTYAGGVNGVGPGQCFVKNGAGTAFVPASDIYVGAIHVASTNSSTSTGSTGSTGGSATSISGMSSQTATISPSSSTGSSMNSMSGANSQSNTMSSSTGGSMTPISGTSSQTNTMSMSSTAGGSTTAMSGMTGQSSTISMSSTASSPSPSVMTCQNNTQITAANGQQYTIYCDANTDNSGGGAFAQQIYGSGDFMQCNTACGATTGCGAWVWVPYAPGDGGVCYLKSLPQNYTPGNAGEVAGIMVITQSTGMSSTGSSLGSTATSGATMSTQTPTTSSSASPSPSVYGPQCPGANGTTYSDPSGAQYMVLCNTNTNPGAVGSVIEPDFGHCIDACSQQTAPACVAVTYSGTSCYFKSQYQGDAPGTGVQAAVLLSQLNVGSSGSSSSSRQPNSMTTPSRSSTTVMSSPLSGLTAISTAPSTQSGSTSASTGAHSSGQATSSNGVGSQSSSPMTSSNSAISPDMTSTMAPVSSSTMSSSSMMTGGISGSVVSGGTPTGSILTSAAISSMTTGSISTANTNPTGTSSMNMMTSGSMSTGNPNPTGATSMNSNSMSMSMSMGVQNPTTASLSQSNPGSPFSAMQMSASSSLPACPSTTGTQPSNGTMCIDANRNPYNVTYGEVYTGTINRQTAASNLDSCLTLCDASPGCEAVNYIGGECQFLTQITGSSTAAGGTAAIRPPGVSTVYTAPPSMTASPTVATNAPVSNGASTTASSGSGGMTESSVGQSMPGAPGSSTIIATSNAQPSSGTSGVGGGSSGNTQGSNTPTNSGSNSNMLSGTMIKGTTYQPTNGNVPTTQVTMANPSYTPSSSMSSVASGGSGGPGPVSGSNNGITSGMASTPTGGQSQTGSGSIKSNDNQASVSATTTSSPPASTGPVCPNYDQEDYYDQSGGTYNVECNATYNGDIIYSGNSTSTTSTKQKRASIPWTSELCMDACDQNTQCVAIIYDECEHICTLLGDVVSGQVPSSSFCGFSAKKVNGSANNGGGSGTGTSGSGTSVVTVTVSVCAAKFPRTTTMFSTHWVRTCPGNAKCTSAGGGSW